MARKLRIALYQPWVYQKGGMERAILEMTSTRSRHDWTIFTSHYEPAKTFADFKHRKVIELKRVPIARDPISLMRMARTISNQKLPLENFDLLLVSTAGFGEFITLHNHSIPIACFCHTPLRVIHDERATGEYFKGKMHLLPFFSLLKGPYLDAEKRSWHHFNSIVANSLETKKRIVAAGLANENKISIAHPGVDTAKIKPSKVFQKFFLVLGRITALKNIELAIKAFKEAKPKGFKLVIAGAVGEKDKRYYEHLKALAGTNNDSNITFETNVSDSRMNSLYANCYSLVFPALNEDWGMVPIEAMAFGKPVIAANEGGPKESVLDGKTGFLVHPTVPAFSKAMLNLAINPSLAKRMGAAAREHSKQFDWKHFVTAIDAMAEKAAKSKRGSN